MFLPVTFLLLLFTLKANGQEQCKLGVYYETLCPDSIAFITRQLYPTYKALGQAIQLDLVPFGKASWVEADGELSFSCQHGPRECKGNRIQACAKKMFSQNETLNFVNCMESSMLPEQAGKRCAEQEGLNYTPIEECADGKKGLEYLKEQGVATKGLNPKAVFVPWITINSNHTQDIQDRALTDLKGLICEKCKGGAKPAGCPN